MLGSLVRPRLAPRLEMCALVPALEVISPACFSLNNCSQQRRGMARGRNYYIKGGSNKQDISEETRDLLKNAKDPLDSSWKLGHGIQEPLTMDPNTKERKRALQYIVKYRGESINEAENTVKYYPHKDEEVPTEAPSPVLMVRRTKSLYGEPWFNKNYCQQIGLGTKEKESKLVFLPNLPSVSLVLFKIKHLLEITPVTFPNGIPEDFDPETHGYKLKSNGEFIVHPSLKVDPEECVRNADWMKLDRKQIKAEAERHWKQPFNSVLGHSNYHQDTRWRNNSKADSLHVKNLRKKWSG